METAAHPRILFKPRTFGKIFVTFASSASLRTGVVKTFRCPSLADRGAAIKAKEIYYRGGIAIFPLPKDWIEAYEPSGGGTFYNDVPNSGTLRLNVLGFENPDGVTIPPNFEPFRDGLYLRTSKERFVEDGDDCILLSWQIGFPVGEFHFRIANFTYTIEAAMFRGEQAQYEISVVKTVLKMAEFGRELGLSGDFNHDSP